MATHTANGDPRLSLWLRVREFAVPPSMIGTATARRLTGDWAGACAAARVDVGFRSRALASVHGRDLASRIRDDLRHLAPDLLRWHMPRIAPDGLLRPGLTFTLARYETGRPGLPVHLVVRTPPARAAAGQRIGLALWDPADPGSGARGHPHPRPHPRFRLDLHRHLWDARRAGELRTRSGAGLPFDAGGARLRERFALRPAADEHRWAVGRWAAEAAALVHADADGGDPPATGSAVTVRLGGRRLVVEAAPDGGGGPSPWRITAVREGGGTGLPVLPDAATWVPPDLELLRAGLLGTDRLHPLVAPALALGCAPARPSPDTSAGTGAGEGPGSGTRFVDCRGARHRIGLVDGVLAPLDHAPDELRREELLAALDGPPLPCLQVVDETHRRPDSLPDVRERLLHGDVTGALAVVEGLLGPDAVLRHGALRDALETAARGRIDHGLFRSGLAGPGPAPSFHSDRRTERTGRSRPRHALLS